MLDTAGKVQGRLDGPGHMQIWQLGFRQGDRDQVGVCEFLEIVDSMLAFYDGFLKNCVLHPELFLAANPLCFGSE